MGRYLEEVLLRILRSWERKQPWLRQTREKSLRATRGSGRSIYGGKGLNSLDVSLIQFYSYVNVRFWTRGSRGEVPGKEEGRCRAAGDVSHGLFKLQLLRHPRRGSWSVQGCPLVQRGEAGVKGRSYGCLSKGGGSFSWTERRKGVKRRKQAWLRQTSK